MIVIGVDFTSAPSRAKPLWTAHALLDEASRAVHVQRVEPHASFAPLEDLLRDPAPAVLALDFPFGLPRSFVEIVGWPTTWDALIEHVRTLGRPGFERAARAFRDHQPAGRKHPLRACDALAGAASPLNVVHPPVGKMFVEGVVRLARADVRIVPCQEVWRERIALEAYPALVARAAAGRASYKGGDTPLARASRDAVRVRIVDAIRAPAPSWPYPRVVLPEGVRDVLLADQEGDALDAVLCTLQGAWGWASREQAFGVPAHADLLEGWIIDPTLRPRV